MYSVIVSVADSYKFSTILSPSLNPVRKYMHKNNLPDIQVITVQGNKALSENYNKGIHLSKYRIKFFIHEDVDLLDNEDNPLFVRIASLLERFPNAGLIGLAGTTEQTNGFWWESHRESMVGQVLMGESINEHWVWNIDREFYQGIRYIDGLFMATPIDLEFSEDIRGFDLYDNDYCNLVKYKGYDIMVFNHMVRHDSTRKDLSGVNFKHYREKWKLN